jgi:serine/threonine-protein kinase HipA
MAPQTIADVLYQGGKAGVVYWDDARRVAVFQYTPEFIDKGIELAPLKMPLRKAPYQFPNLHESFKGLPGLLADCLPDTYGNVLIDDWLRSQNRSIAYFSPVDRLCYMGRRGMGALEFRPVLREMSTVAEQVDVGHLVELAAKVLAQRKDLSVELDEPGLNEILRVGTSAGGARAKAVIAWNRKTNEVRSGQADVPEGFEHWLLKFDGVSESFDGVQDPQGYGRIEYAYHLMAKAAGINMAECRLFEEGGRAHFMTRRFDRHQGNRKQHYASFFGMAHMAYAAPGTHSHSYEDLFGIVRQLALSPEARLEVYRRMVFNVMGCNRDDHVKNIGFLLGEDGTWRLAPAFDVVYAHNPAPGKWTARQQMSVAGKREGIGRDDFIVAGRNCEVATLPKLKDVIDSVCAVLRDWDIYADRAGVTVDSAMRIGRVIRQQLGFVA